MRKPVAIKYGPEGNATSIWSRAGSCEANGFQRFENVFTGRRDNFTERYGVLITEDDDEIAEALNEMKQFHEERLSRIDEMLNGIEP